MDSLAYIATNAFICVAVNKNLEIKIENKKTRVDNCKKVYKFNSNTLVSFVGYPQRSADIYKYLSNIKSSTNTYDEIVDDLSSIFNYSLQSFQENMGELGMLIRKHRERDGGLKISEFLYKIKDKPHLVQVAIDMFHHQPSGIKSANVIFIISRENNKTVFGRQLFFGQNMIGKKIEMPLDNTNLGFIDVTKTLEEAALLGNKYTATFKPLIVHGWEQDKYQVQALKQATKEALIQGLLEMSPFAKRSDIIFYELSEETNYEFVEPDIKLYSPIEELDLK